MSKSTNNTVLIQDKVLEIYKANNAIMLATKGGEYSPWILGAYFGSNKFLIYLFLETQGKSYGNIKIDDTVAISISKNDAMQDFLQGYGKAVILDDSEEENVRNILLEKMPWFQTYTPVSPVRIDIKKFFVTSLQDKWFPAKVLEM